jgi:branched-chain amino acid transport system substrate-binding protein
MDDQESVNEGRLVAQQLADDPTVMAVIGHLQSHVTVPAAAIYDLAGLVLVAPAATSADLTSAGYRRVFRATFTDGAVGAQLAQYALDQGYRRVAIYYVRTIYGRALANAFEEALSGAGGAQVVTRDSYDPSQELGGETLGPVLSRWRQVEVDAIFLAGEVPSAGRLLRVIRREGVETPIIGGDAMSSPTLLQEAAGAAEGIVVACFFHPDEPRPEVARFNETFRARHGTVPDGGAALGYDVLRLLADAMRKAASPAPEHVAEVLHQVEGWPGVTGSFTFDEKGDLLDRRIPMCVVRDGSFRYLPTSEGPGGSDDQGQEER